MRLAVADNRINEVNLLWSPDALKNYGIDLTEFWNDKELKNFGLADSNPVSAGTGTENRSCRGAPGEMENAPGQLWEIGKHRLHCGDSTNVDDVKLLMNGKRACLFATDPPTS